MLNKIKNYFLLIVGFTLINRHGFIAKMGPNGEIQYNNPKRKTIPSMDDSSWHIV